MPFKIGGKNLLIYVILLLSIANISIILDIPLFRQIFGLILITIIPGSLFLKLIKLSDLDFSEKFILINGLSLSVIMWTGFIANLLYPIIGINDPLSTINLLSNINIAIIFIALLSYKFGDFTFSFNISSIHLDNSTLKTGLILVLILNLSILGALITRFFKNTTVSIIFLLILVIFIILVGCHKLVTHEYYPISIFTIGFSLLINRALVSPYLFGSDIQYEYYFAQIVQINSYWDLFGHGNLNSMLSVNILPIAFSNISAIDFIWMYKIFFSFLYALVPVGLYCVYKKQIEPLDSFFSCIFFVSFFSFFTVMLWLPRQEIAEFYLVALMIIFFNKKIKDEQKKILLIIFTWSLIVSHYGTTYIYLLYLILVWIGTYLLKIKNAVTKLNIVIISYLMAFTWFISISSASIFYSILDLMVKMYTTIFNDLTFSNSIDADISRGVGIGITDLPFWHIIGNLWISSSQLLALIGFLYCLLKYREIKYDKEFFLFSAASMFLLVACIVVPHFASSLNMNRIYPIILIWFSPLFVQGIETALLSISHLYKNPRLKSVSIKNTCILLILIPYLLFNSGFIYEITDNSSNIGFNMLQENEVDMAHYSNWTRFVVSPIYEQNVISIEWLSRNMLERNIYTDTSRQSELSGYGLIAPRNVHILDINEVPHDAYIYLGLQNVKGNVFLAEHPIKAHSTIYYNMSLIYGSITMKNKIYTNDGAEFYL